MSNPIIIRTEAAEQSTVHTLAQIKHPVTGALATTASAVALNVYDLSDPDETDSNKGTLVLSDASNVVSTSDVLSSPQSWGKDSVGANFYSTIDTGTSTAGSVSGNTTAVLADGGRKYLLEYKLTISDPTGIGVVWVLHYVTAKEVRSA